MIDLEALGVTEEELVTAIIDITAAMRKFNQGRLKRKAIVYLIHKHSGVPIGKVERSLSRARSWARRPAKPATTA